MPVFALYGALCRLPWVEVVCFTVRGEKREICPISEALRSVYFCLPCCGRSLRLSLRGFAAVMLSRVGKVSGCTSFLSPLHQSEPSGDGQPCRGAGVRARHPASRGGASLFGSWGVPFALPSVAVVVAVGLLHRAEVSENVRRNFRRKPAKKSINPPPKKINLLFLPLLLRVYALSRQAVRFFEFMKKISPPTAVLPYITLHYITLYYISLHLLVLFAFACFVCICLFCLHLLVLLNINLIKPLHIFLLSSA